MFGLSQLYQLRGRIGRGKQRAYAYLTTPPDRKLTDTAARRLEVLQSLDQLGAGFSVASHDMDIRGAGNLLGEEQSGHVREVGIELYQEMLEEAVAQMRAGDATAEIADQWSPHINIGASVLIPERYVTDLNVRMALYRRLPRIETREDIDRFAAELIDRFGPLPEEVQHLFDIVAIKQLCRAARGGEDRGRPQGRHHHLPQQRVPQSDRAGEADQRALRHHEGAPRPEGRGHPRLADPRRPSSKAPLKRYWLATSPVPLGRS